MAHGKVVFGDEVLIDLTSDTVTEDTLLKGSTAHGADGEVVTGACTFDADTQDATAKAGEMLNGVTAYVRGTKVTGTMKNNDSVTGYITKKTEQYSIAQGFHDGGGKVGIAPAEQAKLLPENIRQGVTILSVTGTMSGTEGANAQAKEVTPTINPQEVLPDTGYNYLSQVTVKGIPITVTPNAAGGTTVTIG